MEHKKEFKTLIKESIENNQYVGLGNPNAKILFVGKEAGLEIGTELTHGSAKYWQQGNDYSNSFYPKEEKLRNYNHTWQKYQKLYELIANCNDSQKKEYEITFVENVFTTELSNLPAPKTNEAKNINGFKENLKYRKDTFWKSDFIKNFQIIIITASDNQYIETYEGEVCKLFGVKFQQQLICEKGGKIWVHYSDEKSEILPKLVIHTRQLTNGASTDLLHKISEIVSEFIEKHYIEIKVKQ